MRQVTIGLLGCGTVGRGFVGLIDRERERIRERDGVELRIGRILVRDLQKQRAYERACYARNAAKVKL